eukprot:CAMPEP_0185851434 /NCGR_PEP_ID=MMETSP1354-20130828/9574_1 /TAXON_ID=708628 /ORGANISM="Erythrolobus madagascarensis, Strain CCMP3276" /LENGTH=349 /DNA_ID=CAMNT_0028552413 /DNA_START=248 /DNA_END=1297 /DNA_ORIENTATION=+
MSVSRVGFVGVGRMGAPMVTALASTFDVVVFDDDSARASKLCDQIRDDLEKQEQSATARPQVEESIQVMATKVDAVVTMLPSPGAVREVHSAVASALKNSPDPGQRVGLKLAIDCSTTAPDDALALASEYKTRAPQVAFLDAPVSGGVVGAQNRTLSFLVGGRSKDLNTLALPLLQAMGRRVFHCGTRHGSGQAAKLCNNLLLAVTMAGVCESFSLAQKLGLDSHVLADVLRSSSGQCWATDTYNPVPNVLRSAPASHEYRNGFAAELMVKDLNLALDVMSRSSEEHGQAASLPMSQKALDMYEALCKHHPQLDIGALFREAYGGRAATPRIESETSSERQQETKAVNS